MQRNVEIKARLSNIESTLDLVKSIADTGPEVLVQEDTFFQSSKGRLKLRRFGESDGELIYYERPDSEAPAECKYLRIPTAEPDKIVDVLGRSNGVLGVVRKKRSVYIVGQTRVHFDDVERLGQFLELEVVLRPGQSASEGVGIAEDLIERLGISTNDLIDHAYIDMLHGTQKPHKE